MNEATFSRWFLGHCKEQCHFHQRLEVTTGSGVPDSMVMGYGRTIFVEFKWNTRHIRPEQYVWAIRSNTIGQVPVFYLCGFENTGEVELFKIQDQLNDAEPMSKSYKLTNLIGTWKRTKSSINEILDELHRHSPSNL